MKLQFNRRYTTIAVYVVLVFAACLLLVIAAFRLELIRAVFSKCIAVTSPILWGFVIAYLLNPLMKRIEGLFAKMLCRKKKRRKLVRSLSVAASMILLLSVVAGLIAAIIPEVIQNIQSIGEAVQDPGFIAGLKQEAETLITDFSGKAGFFQKYLHLDGTDLQEILFNLISQFELNIGKIFAKDGFIAGLTSGFMSVLNGIKNVFLGMIISIYLLYSKEKFLAQSKKFICAVCAPESAHKIFRFVGRVNRNFIHYFTGVAFDCTLIGVVTFLFMTIVKLPYAPLISVLLALTNAIPIFGPFIGGIPSVLLLLLFSPIKALIFMVFIIILQQIDGNIIAPKILGDQLGLSAFWVMAAVFIGGGLFGFVGMIIASPVFAVIYSICSDYVCDRLEAKGLPVATASYLQEESMPQSDTMPQKEEEPETHNASATDTASPPESQENM